MGSISKRLAQEKQATRHSGWSSTSPAPTVNRKNRTSLVTALLSGRQLRLREVESLPRVTQQGSRQDRPSSPGCLSVCLSACQSPPSCGQQPGPLSLLPSLGGRSDHVHRAAGPPPRAPARGRPGREEPRAASAAPPLRPALPADAGTWRRWKAPCFIFITQHALWRHPAGCLALQNLFIYMGAEEIGSFSASPRILSWGVLYSCLQGRGQD